MWLLQVTVALAECPGTAASIAVALDAAEAAWIQLDGALLATAALAAQSDSGCLGEPLSPPMVARLHRVEGLAAFVGGDEARARAAFAAARSVAPEFVLPAKLLPLGHPARILYETVKVGGVTAPVPPPERGTLTFDAVPAAERPAERASLAWIAVGDVVTASGYLWPEDPLFPYPVAPPEELGSSALPGVNPKVRAGLWACAAGGALASGVTAILAVNTHRRWEATEDFSEEARLYSANHALVGLSVATGALAVGTASVAIVGNW